MESWRALARALLIHWEGLRLVPYKCTEGFWTIGIGHKLPQLGPHPRYITKERAYELFEEDLDDAVIGCRRVVPGWDTLNDVRKAVFISMVFQMGSQGVEEFKSTLKAAREGKWVKVGALMVRSKWAKQTSKRAFESANLMSGSLTPDAVVSR